ncbi:uncharacterized protein LOC125777308 [Bactrocera dorsalis]|uniref:Uncharacterized protein LOC125777308 n=1 Tax=Bactrocera dorsalis TaxID=27457 RepID=A0ABM3JER0_BACDO|nr:uncharacterized protein LOC125777308 [Bactrocera dorsalis]
MLVRSQRGINSWSSLKQALKNDFGIVVSSIEIHRTLRNRRKRQGEDFMEYLYSLMEIGKSINLDDTSLIEYFIEGIPDSRAGKANLYQAKTVKDLKEQVKVYEKIKVPVSKSQFVNANKTSSTSSNIASSSSGSSAKKCYNCGDDSHFVRDCPRKKVKCFKCGVEGHRATECATVEKLVKKEKSANMMKTKAAVKPNKRSSLTFKDIWMNGVCVSALIDTGADVCLMRYDTLLMLDLDVKLTKERVCLVGIGDSELTTIGSFSIRIEVDGIWLEMKFHVAKETDLKYALVVIGNNILKDVDLIVTEDGAEFRQKEAGKQLRKVQQLADKHSEKSSDGADAMEHAAEAVELETKVKGEHKQVQKTVSRNSGMQKAVALEHSDYVSGRAAVAEEPREHPPMWNAMEKPYNEGARKSAVISGKSVTVAGENRVVQLMKEFGELCLVGSINEKADVEVNVSHQQVEQADAVKEMVGAYTPLRNFESPVDMKILLIDDNPVFERPRRMSYADRCVVDEQVTQWLAEGIIKSSISNYASPVVLVSKKDGRKRLCCDYRRLNR